MKKRCNYVLNFAYMCGCFLTNNVTIIIAILTIIVHMVYCIWDCFNLKILQYGILENLSTIYCNILLSTPADSIPIGKRPNNIMTYSTTHN